MVGKNNMNPACLIWCFHAKGQSFMKRIGHEINHKIPPTTGALMVNLSCCTSMAAPSLEISSKKNWIILEPQIWRGPNGNPQILFGTIWNHRSGTVFGNFYCVKNPGNLFLWLLPETHSFSIRRIWLLCPNVYNPTVDTKIWSSKRWKKALAVGKKSDPIRLVPLSLTKDWSTWSTWYPGCNNMLSISAPWILSFPDGKGKAFNMAIIVWVAVPSCSYCLKLPSAPLSPLSLSPPNLKRCLI